MKIFQKISNFKKILHSKRAKKMALFSFWLIQNEKSLRFCTSFKVKRAWKETWPGSFSEYFLLEIFKFFENTFQKMLSIQIWIDKVYSRHCRQTTLETSKRFEKMSHLGGADFFQTILKIQFEMIKSFKSFNHFYTHSFIEP